MADAWYCSPPLTMDINEPFSSHKAAVFFVQTVDIYILKKPPSSVVLVSWISCVAPCVGGVLELFVCSQTYTWERPNTHITDTWFKRAFGRFEVKHLEEPKKRSSFAFNSSVFSLP